VTLKLKEKKEVDRVMLAVSTTHIGENKKPPKLGVWKSNQMVLPVDEEEAFQATYSFSSLIKHPLRGKPNEQ